MGRRKLKNVITNIEMHDSAVESFYCRIKLVILGGLGVGKSALALRFVKGNFSDCHGSTIGAAFLTQIVHTEDTDVHFEIWDTAGQEQFHSLIPLYYRGSQVAIVVYDITSQDSFARAKTWVKEVQRQASPDILIALAGNKADLAENRAVDYEEAKQYAEEKDFLFMETSGKTGENVNEIFLEIARKLPKNESFVLVQNIRPTADEKKRLKKCCK